ncbi:hypothetical protein SLEP1_g40677 [Rubroshorea leprosula]|uniref:BZIP domain-containing protein n=1 Tax=Rubroshorea leprosula TaxID=152421 RepID=A0AAV5L4L4_9ROSI|nr:hypothetical protein SLEP1_g40677 [Rubroshorea leprosula]
MANNGTGGDEDSINEELSPLTDDYILDNWLQSCLEQGSEKNLQPQIGQPSGTEGFSPTCWATNQGNQAAAQTQPRSHGQPAGTAEFFPTWTINQGVQAAAQTQPWPQQQVTHTYGFSPEFQTKQGCEASAATQLLTHGSLAGDEEERRARKRKNDKAYRQRQKVKISVFL